MVIVRHAINGLLRTRRWLAPEVSRRNLPKIRAALDHSGELMPRPREVLLKSAHLAGVPAEHHFHSFPCHRVVLFLHGGAFVMGSAQSHRALVSRLAQSCRAEAYALNYRLAPEHPFPAAIDDAMLAYRALLDLGWNSEQIVLTGDSAGAGLCLALLKRLRNERQPLPESAILFSPWVDLTCTNESFDSNRRQEAVLSQSGLLQCVGYYCVENHSDHPLVSPVRGDLSGLPPVLIQVGSHEVLLDDALTLEQKLMEAGGKVVCEVWPQMQHVWHLQAPFLGEAKRAIQRVGEFVNDVQPPLTTTPLTTTLPAASMKLPQSSANH